MSSQTKQGFAAWANGYWYVDFSMLQLIVMTALAYLALHGYHRIRGRLHVAETDYQVYLRLDGRTLVLSGLADTGNRLEDFFSGLPVIVCSAESLAQLQNGMPIEKLPHYRVIPCATVTSEGVMPLFRPDEICIRQMTQNKCKHIHTVDAMIGIAGTQKTAIFHPKLIGK